MNEPVNEPVNEPASETHLEIAEAIEDEGAAREGQVPWADLGQGYLLGWADAAAFVRARALSQTPSDAGGLQVGLVTTSENVEGVLPGVERRV